MMGRRIVRNRPLTDEERTKYREIRAQVAEELPDIRRRAKAAKPQISLKHVVAALREERQRQGISLAELNKRTGIDRGSLSKPENAEDPNVTMNTLVRYAEAIGKSITVQLQDAS